MNAGKKPASSKSESPAWRDAMRAFVQAGKLRKARRFLEKEIRDGAEDPELHCALGQMLLNGEGGAADPGRAARAFEQAALAGHASACYYLALLYLNGTGVEQDFAIAARYLRRARRAGIAEATCALGTLYREGFGVSQNRTKAKALYREAGNGGVAMAWLLLGKMLLESSRKADWEHARELCLLAAKAGDEGARSFVTEQGWK